MLQVLNACAEARAFAQLLASEGAFHIGKDHQWHMRTTARLADADREIVLAMPHRNVNLQVPDERRQPSNSGKI